MEETKKKKTKKIKKETNENNYMNMLRKMDIMTEEKALEKDSPFNDLNDKDIHNDQMLRVEDLLSNLENKNFKTSKMKQQYSDLSKKGVFIIKLLNN